MNLLPSTNQTASGGGTILTPNIALERSVRGWSERAGRAVPRPLNADVRQLMTPDTSGHVIARFYVWIVLRYTLTITAFGVLTGFLIGVTRRLAPGFVPEHVQGQFDLGAVVNVSAIALICMLVYWRLASKHPIKYFRVGLPVAVLTGLGNFLSNAAIVTSGARGFELWLVAVSVGFHVLIMLIAGYLFGPLRPRSRVA